MIGRVMTNDSKTRKAGGWRAKLAKAGMPGALWSQGGRALCPHGRPLCRAVNTETTAGIHRHRYAGQIQTGMAAQLITYKHTM